MKNIEDIKNIYRKRIKQGYETFEMSTIYTGLCGLCKEIFYSKSPFAEFCSRGCFAPHNNMCRSREKNPRWKGGVTTKEGYRILVINKKVVKEHRWIMEQHLGRKLLSSEVVHHINHNKLDNRLENLTIMTQSEHSRHHNNLHS